MKINETLRFFRKNNHQFQKDIGAHININRSTYSRIEKGDEKIKLDDFLLIIDRLSLTAEEVFILSENNPVTYQKKYEQLYIMCSQNPEDIENKKKLLSYYDNLIAMPSPTIKEMSDLLGIKHYFSTVWEEVAEINQQELDRVYKHLNKREYYTTVDYALLLRTIVLFEEKKANKLIIQMIPIPDIENRSEKLKDYAYNSLRNLITANLYKMEYYTAIKYISYAKKQFPDIKDYRLKMHIVFLEYVVSYLTTNNLTFYEKTISLIQTVKELGDNVEVANMESDLNNLVKSKNSKKDLENIFNITI